MFTFKDMGTELYLEAKAFSWMLIDNTHPYIPSTYEIVWASTAISDRQMWEFIILKMVIEIES